MIFRFQEEEEEEAESTFFTSIHIYCCGSSTKTELNLAFIYMFL